jgi:K+-transporting ATPase KdpF subunit
MSLAQPAGGYDMGVVVLIVGILLIIYLMISVIRPEKF